jgi:DNA recombination protein RmuC
MDYELTITLLACANTIILLWLLLGKKDDSSAKLKDEISVAVRSVERLERTQKDDSARQREESTSSFKSLREEIGNLFRAFEASMTKNSAEISSIQKNQFETFSSGLSKANKDFEEKISKDIQAFTELQKQKIEDLENRLAKMKSDIDILLEKIRDSMEKNLKNINEENAKKLDEIRKTVDEKLHDALEKRLSESFKQVSERLKQVHEGLGEMKTLAVGVGDLKKVLSNVKTRGILGEIQLSAILENILSPTQYEKNVRLKNDSQESVEFAIKFPERDETGAPLYMPIDSKFPYDKYHNLVDAYNSGDVDKIERESKILEDEINRCAKTINEKYIHPPETTDFAIMFLPFEGLYAEVIKNSALVEKIQNKYHVAITGPSTLAAFLNSVRMGFKALAIQKRTTEVWTILSAVKTEFKKFGEILMKAREKITKAGDEIDELVGKRTRKIQSRLKSLEELPEARAAAYIDADSEDDSK